MVFWRLGTLKICTAPRREHDFHKIDVFEKVAKNVDFGLVFAGQNDGKSRKNGVEKCVFFLLPFFGVFFRFFEILARFWEARGRPKIDKKSKKLCSGCDWDL